MERDLIYDVGMYDGTDTDFYLKKGFRVVAIEANPELVRRARQRFADAIASARLTILNVVVSDHDGPSTFYVSRALDEGWSTALSGFARQMGERPGAHFEPIDVESRRFESILEAHGVPYYLKVDVEGAELLCLRALEQFSERPMYVSVEVPDRSAFAELEQHEYEDLCRLFLLGYRGFKILDQRFHSRIELPEPAREGRYVAHEFRGHTTGPFGEETPGSWLPFEQVVPAYAAALRRMHPAWFDLHARRPAAVSSAQTVAQRSAPRSSPRR